MENLLTSKTFKNAEEYGWITPDTKAWLKLDEKEKECFKKCRIIEIQPEKELLTISVEKSSQPQQVHPREVFLRSEEEQGDVKDMTDMECLNEAELLFNLKRRYIEKSIYTYVGPTLIAMNPFAKIDGLYSEDAIKEYKKLVLQDEGVMDGESPKKKPKFSNQLEVNSQGTRDKNKTVSSVHFSSQLNPHVFGIAAHAYNDLFFNEKKQAIVISGESGAGKTENTKFCMKFLTSLHQGSQSLNDEDQGSNRKTKIEERILNCNPVLEAFGNAKTVRNDNSSRFGKYVQIIFDKNSRKIKGAQIENYLLEKSRITSQQSKERSFHIFYQMMQGADQDMLKQFFLDPFCKKDLQKLEYLNKSKCYSTSGIDDNQEFQDLLKSMEVLGFTSIKDTIFSMVASVLLLGNIQYDDSSYQSDVPCKIKNPELLEQVCKLLRINLKELEKRMGSKSRTIAGKEIISPFNKEQCINSRDALAKYLYYNLFGWIVSKLNETIVPDMYEEVDNDSQFVSSVCSEDEDDYQPMRNSEGEEIDFLNNSKFVSIGILDIYGFEVFNDNGFEQFFINYTNEKLQQLYIFYIFKQEKQIFIKEGLEDKLNHLNFTDNQAIIDLLDKPPFGIFNLLDETCFVNGNDDGFLSKIRKQHGQCQHFAIPKMTSKKTFIINHSAKSVEYTTTNFVEKNKDDMQQPILEVLSNSNNVQIQKLFSVILEQLLEQQTRKAKKTMGSKFRVEMQKLMDELLQSDCHFIRCIKSNDDRKPLGFTERLVQAQVQCLGILESIKVRLESYPIRQQYRLFYKKYSYITFPKESYPQLCARNADFKSLVQQLIQEHMKEIGEDLLLYGKTKLFLRNKAIQMIDIIYQQKIQSFVRKIVKFQRLYRRHLRHRALKRVINAIKFTQKMWKIHKQMMELRRKKAAVRKLQKWWRKIRGQERRMKFRRKTMLVQNFVRTQIKHNTLQRFIDKVKIIQRCARRMLTKMALKKELLIKDMMEKAIKMGWDRIRNMKAVIIQKMVRGKLVRLKYKKEIYEFRIRAQMKKCNAAALLIQKVYKGQKQRKLYLRQLKAIHIIQDTIYSFYISNKMRRRFLKMRRSAIIIQRNVRPYVLKKLIIKQRMNEYEYKENVEENIFQEEFELFGENAYIQMQQYEQKQNQQQSSQQSQKKQSQQDKNVSSVNQQQSVESETVGQNTQFQNQLNQNYYSNQIKKNISNNIQNQKQMGVNQQFNQNQKKQNNYTKQQQQQQEKIYQPKQNKDKYELLKELRQQKHKQLQQSSQQPLHTQQQQLTKQLQSTTTTSNLSVHQKEILEQQRLLLQQQQQEGWKNNLFDATYTQNLAANKVYLFNQILDLQMLTDTRFIYSNDLEGKTTWSNQYSDIFSTGYPSSNYIQNIQIGDAHTLCSTSNSNIYAFGWNDVQQCGIDYEESANIEQKFEKHFVEIKLHNKVQMISTNKDTNLALDEKGNVFQWGKGKQIHLLKGNLPEDTNNKSAHYLHRDIYQTGGKQQIQNKQIKYVKAGSLQNYAVDFDGNLYAWPLTEAQQNEYEEKERDFDDDGHVDFYLFNLDSQISTFQQKIQIASVTCGLKFSLLLSQSGMVFSYGENKYGQLGHGDKKNKNVPQIIEYFKNCKVQEVDCGLKHCIARCSNNKVYTWGWGEKGQLGHEDNKNQLKPLLLNIQQITASEKQSNMISNDKSHSFKVLQVKASRTGSLFLYSNGSIYWFGSNAFLKTQNVPIKLNEIQRCPQIAQDIFYPVRIQSSYSDSLSIISITYAFTSKDVQMQKNVHYKQKMMNILTSKWTQNQIDSINPPYDENLSHHISITNMMRGSHHKNTVNAVKQKIQKITGQNVLKSQQQSNEKLSGSKQFKSSTMVSAQEEECVKQIRIFGKKKHQLSVVDQYSVYNYKFPKEGMQIKQNGFVINNFFNDDDDQQQQNEYSPELMQNNNNNNNNNISKYNSGDYDTARITPSIMSENNNNSNKLNQIDDIINQHDIINKNKNQVENQNNIQGSQISKNGQSGSKQIQVQDDIKMKLENNPNIQNQTYHQNQYEYEDNANNLNNISIVSQISHTNTLDQVQINLLDSDQNKIKNVQSLQRKIEKLKKIPKEKLSDRDLKLLSLSTDKYFIALTETIQKEINQESLQY